MRRILNRNVYAWAARLAGNDVREQLDRLDRWPDAPNADQLIARAVRATIEAVRWARRAVEHEHLEGRR